VAGRLRIVRQVELAAALAGLASVVLVVLAGTAGRYLGHPLVWSDEVAQALFIWLAMLSADLTLQRGGHFRIDLLYSFLPRPAILGLELAIKLTILGLLVVLAYYGLALMRLSHPRPLPMTGVPSSYAAAALPVAYALMAITALEQFIQPVRSRTAGPAEAGDVM